MNDNEKAAAHAAKAEELLDESKKTRMAARTTLLASQANTHATLAVFYAQRA